jgi:hypothetical protein
MAPVFPVPALPTTIAGTPRAPVVGDRLLQQVDADAEAVVGRDLPELLPADAEQVDRLVMLWTSETYTTSGSVLAKPASDVGRHGVPARERRGSPSAA